MHAFDIRHYTLDGTNFRQFMPLALPVDIFYSDKYFLYLTKMPLANYICSNIYKKIL